MNTSKKENYYTAMQSKMIRDFETMFICTKKAVEPFLGYHQIQTLHEQARKVYQTLLPQIPYIGGRKVSGTKNLIGGAQMLAIIRGLEQQGLSEEEIGKVIYVTWVELFNRIPKIAGYFLGKIMLSGLFLKNYRKRMKELQKRRYPEAFVSEYVHCADGSFDFGQNTLECAICKFYKKQNASKYLPYICLGDYPLYQRLGICFFRTKTLGNGDDVCDFRFKKIGDTVAGWPPEELLEWRYNKTNDSI